MKLLNPVTGYHRRLRAAKNLTVLDQSLMHQWRPVVGKRRRSPKSNLHANRALPVVDQRRPMAQILESLWARTDTGASQSKVRVRTAIQVILEANQSAKDWRNR